MASDREITLGNVWSAIWRGKWIVVGVTVVAALVAFALTFTQDTTYTATSKVYLGQATTMMGNLAGAFANLYFLAMRLPKNDFIGTAAWLFLVINLFKLPFQVFFWKNIHADTLLTDIVLLPALALGFVTGLRIVRHLQDSHYRRVVIVLTLIGAVAMLLK